MSVEDEVRTVVYDALKALNEEQPADGQIVIADGTALFGGDSMVDSLALVSVVIDVETAVSTQFDKMIALTDDRAMSRQPSPFDTVGNLIGYVVELVEE